MILDCKAWSDATLNLGVTVAVTTTRADGAEIRAITWIRTTLPPPTLKNSFVFLDLIIVAISSKLYSFSNSLGAVDKRFNSSLLNESSAGLTRSKSNLESILIIVSKCELFRSLNFVLAPVDDTQHLLSAMFRQWLIRRSFFCLFQLQPLNSLFLNTLLYLLIPTKYNRRGSG